jgi:hypothetical protein
MAAGHPIGVMAEFGIQRRFPLDLGKHWNLESCPYGRESDRLRQLNKKRRGVAENGGPPIFFAAAMALPG